MDHLRAQARRSPLFVWFAKHGAIWPVIGLLAIW